MNSAQKAHAFLDEERVAHRERLVDHQDVGVDVRDDREGEPDDHAGRVRLDRLIDELADAGKLRRSASSRASISPGRQSENRAVEKDVLAAGELRVETGAQFEHGGHASRRVATEPCVGVKRAADDLQQRGLAGAVPADDSHDLALPDAQRDAVEREKVAIRTSGGLARGPATAGVPAARRL